MFKISIQPLIYENGTNLEAELRALGLNNIWDMEDFIWDGILFDNEQQCLFIHDIEECLAEAYKRKLLTETEYEDCLMLHLLKV